MIAAVTPGAVAVKNTRIVLATLKRFRLPFCLHDFATLIQEPGRLSTRCAKCGIASVGITVGDVPETKRLAS